MEVSNSISQPRNRSRGGRNKKVPLRKGMLFVDISFRIFLSAIVLDMLLPDIIVRIGSLARIAFAVTFLVTLVWGQKVFRAGLGRGWGFYAVFLIIFFMRAVFTLSENQNPEDVVLIQKSILWITQYALVAVIARGIGRIQPGGAKRYLLYFSLNCSFAAFLMLFGFGVGTRITSGGERIFAANAGISLSGAIFSFGVAILAARAIELLQARKWYRAIVLIGATAPMCFLIVHGGARVAGIALVTSLISLIFLSLRSSRQIITSIVIVICVVGLFGYLLNDDPGILQRYIAAIKTGEMSGREIIFPTCVQMLLERPILGWGPITNLAELSERTHLLPVRYLDAHNNFLWIATGLGVLGLLPFVLMWLHAFFRSLHADSENRLVLSISVIVVLISGLSFTTLFTPVFWSILGFGETPYSSRAPVKLKAEKYSRIHFGKKYLFHTGYR